jgi:hypothetical protein
MKKHAPIVLLLFLGLPWAAARAQQAPLPPFRTGPLRLEKVSFSKTKGNCNDGPCVTASIDYLKVVSAENAQAGARLTAAIANWVLRLPGGRVAKNPQEVIDEFVDSTWETRQGEAKPGPSFSRPLIETITLEVEYQSPRALSLSLFVGSYTGGAHPNEWLTYANFRPATGERIHLTDIFKQGFTVPLNAVGERRFRELKGLGPQESLKNTRFRFPNDQFQLNDNFAINTYGLVFYFQDYEIGPHAEGPTKLFLPYKDIRDLLRPDADIP